MIINRLTYFKATIAVLSGLYAFLEAQFIVTNVSTIIFLTLMCLVSTVLWCTDHIISAIKGRDQQDAAKWHESGSGGNPAHRQGPGEPLRRPNDHGTPARRNDPGEPVRHPRDDGNHDRPGMPTVHGHMPHRQHDEHGNDISRPNHDENMARRDGGGGQG